MLNSPPIRFLWRSLGWLTRLVMSVSVIAAVLIGVTIIVLRYWILPSVEQYHSQITTSVAGAIGHPVTIGKIRGDWRGFQPRLNFTDVNILNERQQPALALQNIDASVSWMSLFAGELRLASLEIDKPELLVRRDAQGGIFVGGVALAGQGGNNDLANWLLHQSRMVVRDALIVWVDEQRDAPPLVLQQVNLRIENLFSHHRFALRALPPDELSTPLDVRGDFSGASFDDLGKWRGQLFTEIDYTDVTAWRSWLDMPDEFSQGRGALRGWLGIERGGVAQIVADLDLRDVVTRLSATTPEMAVLNLHGRVSWRDVPGGMDISTGRLAMQLQNGIELRPTDFYFRTATGRDQSASGELRVNQLQLENLVSLAEFLPLESSLRDQLGAYSPSGRVSNLGIEWQGVPGRPGRYSIKGKFENIAVHQVGRMPGFSGLTADVDGNDEQGRLNVSSYQLRVDAPGIMREALLFNILTGQVGWRSEHGELVLSVDNVAVANDDLAGNLYGSYQTLSGTRGLLDLTARLTRGDISKAARYTPLIALHQQGGDWLNGALVAGHTEDLRIRIKGNLSDFPLKDNDKEVLFKIGGHARDAVLAFDKDWPRIENITGEFLIRGNKLEVLSPAATMAGARLQNIVVTIPDMTSDDPVLEINGEAQAGNETFLQFIQHSPVRGYINGFTDGVRASGNGYLSLFVHIPLDDGPEVPVSQVLAETNPGGANTGPGDSGHKPVQVSGNLRVQGSDIDLGPGVPWLRNTGGVLTFTESGMQASGISTEILGGKADINVRTGAGGTVQASVKGRANLDVLRNSKAHPLLNYLRGSTAWDLDISVVNQAAKIIFNSDLRGLSSTLPQPLSKSANESLPLHVEKFHVAAGQDLIVAQLGDLLGGRLERSDQGGEMVIKRGTVNFGAREIGRDEAQKKSVGRKRPQDGVWVTGNLPALSIQGWNDLLSATNKSAVAVPLAGIDLSVGSITGYGYTVGALKINAGKRGDGLVAQLAGEALNGEVTWLPRGYEAGGKLSARLRNLTLSEDKQSAQQLTASTAAEKSVKPAAGDKAGQADARPHDIPALDIAIDDLQIKENSIGRFEMVGHPEGQDWRLRRLNITNPDGKLAGDGIWRAMQRGAQTHVNLQLALIDAGNTLARSGYPGTVKGGRGKLTANLSWDGTPEKFNYATLNGSLELDTGKGRFLKMDPGAGKLLSILSLQALPKRIALDFDDVFTTGFEFDQIKGNATIDKGVIDTRDLQIEGSAAKVTMKGRVDLNAETQNLRVKVLPSVGAGVSLLTAFAAGPVVGVGALIVNKVLGDPLDNLVSFEYNVDGTWSNPNVVKVGSGTAK